MNYAAIAAILLCSVSALLIFQRKRKIKKTKSKMRGMYL